MATAAAQVRRGLFARPTAKEGWWSWVTTVDHKKIGIMYIFTALFFFLLGGIEALMIRAQLAGPNGQVLSADAYNQIFTMHGITMIFLVVMPLGAGLMNYFVPLMIGARDVAFPRINAFSYWVFAFGGLFLYTSFFLGGAPDGGWFGYAPLNRLTPSDGMTYYSLSLQILGIASLGGAINFIVTILNMRAPGMTLMRMPVFVWMTLVTSFLLLFAMPIIAVALFQLMFDRVWGTNFFNPVAGGDPLLWQHLFWLFGHPEVYIMILPAMGIVSEILPTFSRKPIFGYAAIVFAGIAIGFMGWGVWAHHMFVSGMNPHLATAFMISTMLIALPSSIKVFNWLGTMWRGSIRSDYPTLFAVGFVTMFVIGGLSGVSHAIVPHDGQQTDTYYIVAHFHYVLFGGALFGLVGGFYYWWPKMFGYHLSEALGKLHFWTMFIGFNMAFFPMHILGLQGMPRRQDTYPDGMGWNFWNLISTIGAFIILVAFLVFAWNILRSRKKGEEAGDDPWDARTIEWMTASPPPEHNFDVIPTIEARDDFWHKKYLTDDEGEPVKVFAGGADIEDETEQVHHEEHIHMPDPSYWPVVAALGLPVLGFGVLNVSVPTLIAGGLIVVLGLFGWALEPSAEEH
ncbi:MAG: cytochrome c oxidase subunit I [Actinomycetota bacterium]